MVKKNYRAGIFILLLLSITTGSIAQNMISLSEVQDGNIKKESEKAYHTVNDLKTGNWQTVLSSFLQLSLSDLAGDQKAINFKANLFALKAKADSNLLLDYNYVRQTFSRNFQFDFSLQADTQYRFRGFKSGFTWAIINKRDSAVVSFIHSPLDAFFSRAQELLQTAFNNYRNSLLDINGNLPQEKVAGVRKIKDAIDNVLNGQGFAPIASYPADFQAFLAKEYDTNIASANKLFNEELEKLRIKPLLTLSVSSTFENKSRALSNGAARLVYLQGLKTRKSKTELDIRAGASLKDTLVSAVTSRRSVFSSSAGINFALLENQSNRTIIEFKPYIEYNSILSNRLYSGEQRSSVFFNAALRFRILDNLWLPFTIKYDKDKKKLFGFLDIEFNISAFKKQK